MSRKRKTKPKISSKLDSRSVHWAPDGSHPSQVSGIFKGDVTFEEFREILRQQREEDYRRANEEIDSIICEEEEAEVYSSLTPTLSQTTKTRTQSSARK